MKFYYSLFIVLFLGSTAAAQYNEGGAPVSLKFDSIQLEPCSVPAPPPANTQKVLCGKYAVFENRALKKGRKISLKVVVFPATGQNRAPDPVFYIAGGPGSSAIEEAPYVAYDLTKVRERRDLVFLDQRGTGESNPLICTLFNPSDPQSYLGHWNPPEDVRRCRAELEPKADLSLYTTSIAMDDLDDVRAALGYQTINLRGGSYGTRAALEYLKRHGKRVRSVILQGVMPTGQFMPRDFPRHTEIALNGVLDECLADEACRTAFPNLRAEVKTVLERLLRGPVEVEVKFPPKGQSVAARLSRDLAAEAVRYMLYQTNAAGRIPLFLHLAAQGNYTPLAEAAISYRQRMVASGGTGMYLTVTCAEDLPWIKPGEGERMGKNTFLGDYRLRQQREACSLWPRAEIPKDYAEPTRSEVPVLLLSGQWDPVTPSLQGDMAAKHLPNSLHVVVPSGGHGFGGLEGLGCISKLMFDFIDKGNTRELDTSCVKGIRRRGFLLKLPESAKSS